MPRRRRKSPSSRLEQVNLRRFFRPAIEVAAILGVVLAGFALNLGGVMWNQPKVANSALLLFALPVAWLFGAGLYCLVRKWWLGGIVRLVSLPAALFAGLLAIVVAQIVGFTVVEAGWPPAKSPLPSEAVEPFERAARAITVSAPDGTRFTLRGLRFTESQGTRRVEIELGGGGNASLTASPDYTLRDGRWVAAGTGFSAPTNEEVEALRAATRVPDELVGDLAWPVPEAFAEHLNDAAKRLAGGISQQAFDGTDPVPVALVRSDFWIPESGSPRVALVFGTSGGERLVWTDWRWNGEVLTLADVTMAGSREQSAAAKTAVLEAIREDEFLRPREAHGPEWRRVETKLADGTRIAYLERAAHPFLAEYHMRVGITPAGGTERVFELPMNTGGRTAVFVSSGRTTDGRSAVRLTSQHFDSVFTLSPSGWAEVSDFQDGREEGAFLAVHTPLAWFPAGDAEIARVRELGTY